MDQDSLETSLLCILYEKANGRNHFESFESVAAAFRPSTTSDRVRLGIHALVEKKFAEPEVVGAQQFKITSAGIAWVESEHSIALVGENYQFRRRKAASRIDVPKVGSGGWSKSGAIAAWIGVAVMVIGVVVAIYLDYN